MRVFTITEDVFKTEPLFVTDCSYVELQRYCQRRFKVTLNQGREGCIGMMATFDVTPWRLVWVERSKPAAPLLHELFHLVTRICSDKGIPIVSHHPNGDHGDETSAYLYEFFADRLIKKLGALR